MDNEKKEREIFKLTSNIVQKKKLFNKIPYANLIEGVVLSGITIFIINILPFVDKFKLVASITYAVVIMIFCCKGIYNRCFTLTLIDYIKYLKNRKILHLGDMNDERKNEYKSSRFGSQSYAERGIGYIKDKYNSIKDRINNNKNILG